MPITITLNQAAKPAGLPGISRNDFDLGVPVDVQVNGGPFLQQSWVFIDKPPDFSIPSESAAVFTNPNAPITQVTNVDNRGTYLIKVSVDQGFGLGARPEDVSTIFFYAGAALSTGFNLLPRRHPAFGETTEDNTNTPPFAANPRGWASEMDKWLYFIESLGLISNLFAALKYDGGSLTITKSLNIASVVRVGPGIFAVTFTNPAPDNEYLVLTSNSDTPGFVLPAAQTPTDFGIYRADLFNVLADESFVLLVLNIL